MNNTHLADLCPTADIESWSMLFTALRPVEAPTETADKFEEWKRDLPTLSQEERAQEMLEYLLDPNSIQRENYSACKGGGRELFYWLNGQWLSNRG